MPQRDCHGRIPARAIPPGAGRGAKGAPEVALRSELHRRGLRFRVHRKILDNRRTHDIVFPRQRVVVDVRGCYWHGCEEHSRPAVTHTEWWREKMAGNRRRDSRTVRELRRDGWAVVVVWEHEPVDRAARRVERVVRGRRGPAGPAVFGRG